MFDLDAVALFAAAVVDVVEGDDAFGHDVVAVIGSEVEALGVTGAVVDVVSS